MRPHHITNILMERPAAGLSINVYGKTPTDGYMVGGEVTGLVIDEDKNYQPYLTTDEWLEGHWDLLNKPGYYAGIWTDSESGLVYVDISRNVADLYSALAIAASRGEYSIWDVAHGVEVHTEESD